MWCTGIRTITALHVYVCIQSVVALDTWLLSSTFAFSPLQGRFSLAARYHATCAEIYEVELVNYEKVRLLLEH